MAAGVVRSLFPVWHSSEIPYCERPTKLRAMWLGCLGVWILSLISCVNGPRPDIPPTGAFVGADGSTEPVAGVVPVEAGQPKLFVTSRAIRGKMLELIEGARDSILINSFLVTSSESSSEIVAALAAKQEEGVRVHVMADACSRFPPERSLFRELGKAGIPWAEFHPVHILTWPLQPKLIERDHRKVWIIDGRTVFLGGANITGESLGKLNHGGNLDFMVAFDSPEAARMLIKNFVSTWNYSSRDKLCAGDFARPGGRPSASRAWVFDQQLNGGESIIGPMFAALFQSAQHEIWLVHSYTFTNPVLLEMIEEAVARGVEVNIVLASHTNYRRFIYASYYGIADIQKVGGRVWIYEDQAFPLHFKGAIADGRWTCVGSANLNFRSFVLSREIAAVFDDADLARQFGATVEEVQRGSRLVSHNEARRYRTPRYWFWWSVMQHAG